MPGPQLWIIAGPNGAGKTTLANASAGSFGLPAGAFINPDSIALNYLRAQGVDSWEAAPQELLKVTFIRAANDAQRDLEQRIERGHAVVVESVLSTSKYCGLVERVLQLGGEFRLIYIALISPELSKQRVASRVSQGGHDVPADKLEARWSKSLELLPWFAFKADEFWIIDNSSSDKNPSGLLLVSGQNRVLRLHGVPDGLLRAPISSFITKFTEMNSSGKWRVELDDRYEPPAA